MSHIAKYLSLATICFASVAAAQPAPPPNGGPMPDKAEMARHAAQMCLDHKARATGEMAYLEAKLVLNDKQKPLFERWKSIKLKAANTETCPQPPEGEPSLIDQMRQEEKMLRTHLDTLKAELPALEALYASLTDDQKKAFHPGPRGMGAPDRMGPHTGGFGPSPDREPGKGPGPNPGGPRPGE
jgi:hypothetical protein